MALMHLLLLRRRWLRRLYGSVLPLLLHLLRHLASPQEAMSGQGQDPDRSQYVVSRILLPYWPGSSRAVPILAL